MQGLIEELKKTFTTLAIRTGDVADMKTRIGAYVEELKDYPLPKVAATLKAFRVGALGDGKFVPTLAEIVREVTREEREAAEREKRLEEVNRRNAERDRREAEQLAERRAAVERRKNLAPGAMARADELMRRFRESLPADPLKAEKKPYSEITREEAEHNLKTIREHVGGYCELSDDLRKMLGLPSQAEAGQETAARIDDDETAARD